MIKHPKRKPPTQFKITQHIKHPDGSVDKKERTYESIKDLKRALIIMGFPTHVTYELQKHGRAHFDYEEFAVDMTLESI